MIAATLTTRLAQDGIRKSTVTTFTLAFLFYNLKFLSGVDTGRRPSAVARPARAEGLLDPPDRRAVHPRDREPRARRSEDRPHGRGLRGDPRCDSRGHVRRRDRRLSNRAAGATAAWRRRRHAPYGWRIGSVLAASIALYLAARANWHVAYIACAVLVLPAMAVALLLGAGYQPVEDLLPLVAGQPGPGPVRGQRQPAPALPGRPMSCNANSSSARSR